MRESESGKIVRTMKTPAEAILAASAWSINPTPGTVPLRPREKLLVWLGASIAGWMVIAGLFFAVRA